jgi:L-fuculose-phosphate aldolase
VNHLGVARDICRVGRRLMERGLVAGTDGNIAVRLAGDRVLVTPSGRAKGELSPEDLVEVDLAGHHVRGANQASSELGMHLVILRVRPDVVAVVHAHPPTATGFTLAGLTLDEGVIPELVVLVGPVPLVPYAMPGTPDLGEMVASYARDHDALLLANHGAVTMGRTLDEAHHRMESLEHSAQILLAARLLGGVEALGPADVARLLKLREQGEKEM